MKGDLTQVNKSMIVPQARHIARSLLDLPLRILSTGGVPRLFHRLAHGGQGSVLMYHGVENRPLPFPDWCFIDEKVFLEQMKYVARHFDVVPLLDLPGRLAAPGPQPPAAITFDDGYADNYRVAFPILRRLGLPATIFLNTSIIGSDHTVWFARLNEALARSGREELEWNGRRLPIVTGMQKRAASTMLQAVLKELPHERLLRTCDQLIRALGDDPARPLAPEAFYRMLNAGEVAEMAASGLIEFGAHTHTHAILAHLDHDELRTEIELSIAGTERLSGQPCRSFAYPNGRAGDFDRRAVNLLKELGIEVAVTTIDGPNCADTPPLLLRRYGIGCDMESYNFRLEIHHLKHCLRRRPEPAAGVGLPRSEPAKL